MNTILKRFVKRILSKYGYEIKKQKEEICTATPYIENEEVGPVNLSEKNQRQASGGSFEWPDMVILNKAVVKLLDNEKRILEIGCGTGCFAYHTSKDLTMKIFATEFDIEALNWAKKNRSAPNIKYSSTRMEEFDSNSFDIVVSIDVIEHIKDFSSFLWQIKRLAPKLIITTPNKRRSHINNSIGPPTYHQHVREWNAGEFYWVLRSFYKNVILLGLPDPLKEEGVPLSVLSSISPMIAICDG